MRIVPHKPLNWQLAGTVECNEVRQKGLHVTLALDAPTDDTALLQGPHLQSHLDPGACAAHEAHGAARGEHLNCGAEGRGDARRFEAPLGSTPAREASHLIDQLWVCGIDGVRRPQTTCER
jgi:hypothetical protein